MIQDVKELAASLRYISVWADKLEGLRRHSADTDAALLPTTSAGPLAEIRRGLQEAREFVDGLAEGESFEETAEPRSPLLERQKVA